MGDKKAAAAGAQDRFPILVVEDDLVTRRLLVKILLKAGHQVTEAENGRVALQRLEENYFPIIVSDWVMPEVDGLSLCRTVRASFHESYVYIIMLTAKNTKTDIIRGLGAGADDYLTKPFNDAELIARINTGGRIINLERSLKNAYAEIKSLSVRDPLTGCYNRGYLIEKLPHEIKRADRYHRPLSVILCDIDHFKRINDTFGHQAGDLVLAHFVTLIQTHIRRDIDWIARYGGEEFVVVFPETGLQDTFKKADKLREMVCRNALVYHHQTINYSVSLGVSALECLTGAAKRSADHLINLADVCLYKAKKQGRNRVVKNGALQ